MTMHNDIQMEYLLEKPTRPRRAKSPIRNLFSSFLSKKVLLRRIDGLQADYAIAMDQCQLMKQHILELENKIGNVNAKVELQPEAKDIETPYSVAILLAKRGCGKDEIIKECGLTDSEADLILTLHNRAPQSSPDTIAVN